MKNVWQVLQQKETEIERLRQEIQALHSVIPLLVDDQDWIENGLLTPPARMRRADAIGTAGRLRV